MDHTSWNDRYTHQPELYGTAPNEYFRSKIMELNPSRLLIPGEGEGRQTLYAASLGWQVTAFDSSEVARNNALEKASSSGLPLQYLLSKAEHFVYAPPYDAAALIYFHLPPSISSSVHKK